MRYNINYIFRRVITFFIIFIILSFIKSCRVHAEENVIMGGTENGVYETSPYARFYNNTNGSFVASTTSVDNDSKSFWTTDTVTSNGYGEGIAFDLNTVLVKDMTYTITIYLASDYNNLYYYYKNSVNYPRLLSCGNSLGGAVGNFNDGHGILADFQKFSIGSAKIQIYTLDGTPVYRYGNYLTYVFKASDNCGTMFIPFNAFTTTTHYTGYLGYNLYTLGNTNQLSANDMNTILSNSGLATAQDIASLRSAITQMQSDISSSISAQSQQQHTDAVNTQNAINNVNSSINNDNIDNADSKTTEWNSKNLSDNAVSSMVTMPITLLNAYLNGLNGSCSPYSLGTLFEHEIILPCINIGGLVGSTLWGIIDVLFSGFMIYAIGKKFVKIFNDFTNLKDNQVNELYGGGN